VTALPVEDVQVDVDLTKDVPCAMPDCPNPATWALTNTCGNGCTWTICDPHKTATQTGHNEPEYLLMASLGSIHCALPRPVRQPHRDLEAPVSRTFTARYPGRCAACDDPIEPGEALRYDPDEQVVHADCDRPTPATAATRRVPAAVCPTCHLTRPCDCEEQA